ncbi:hypothetical protein FALBO_1600 [Fusarium albosuccineum]|uniref:Uncharacterized protein n=1 Tax=Fusarium albosuccineum TaxID=1237068 RepID=A0A8H4LNJ8_9HYPO|nr:hypothetical protein FALBO_1600 [Fusarium albosuccineum]
MPDNLAKQLGKAQVEAKKTSNPLHRPETWEAARKAHAAGIFSPLPNYPIVVNNDGPVSTSEQLQEILEMASPPKLIQTTTVSKSEEHDEPGTGISICSISLDEREKLEERAKISRGPTVWFEDQHRYSYRVVCLLQDGKEPHNTESN